MVPAQIPRNAISPIKKRPVQYRPFLYLKMLRKKRFWKRLAWGLFFCFLLLNALAFMHAWRFTHFSESGPARPGTGELSLGKKIQYALTGVPNPRPQTGKTPEVPFQTIVVDSNYQTSCWFIPTDSAVGTMILLHGYGGEKSSMLDKASLFQRMGWNCLLVDFRGSGQTAGHKTSIGFYEAEQVKAAFDWVRQQTSQPIWIFGTSMGAAAALRAVAKEQIVPAGLILECPFGSLLTTTKARFRMQGIPSFPMAPLLVFWGGVQQGFNGFEHNPEKYASAVQVPTLLLYGKKDPKVSLEETENIFHALRGPKSKTYFPEAGHENYLNQYRNEWINTVSQFLETHRQ